MSEKVLAAAAVHVERTELLEIDMPDRLMPAW